MLSLFALNYFSFTTMKFENEKNYTLNFFMFHVFILFIYEN